MANPGRCWLLESLPNEFISSIIGEMDSVRNLANFVTTCHALYENFLSRKHHYLLCAMQLDLGPLGPIAVFLFRHGYNSARVYEDHDRFDTFDKMSFVACDHSLFVHENSKTSLTSLIQGDSDEIMGVYTELRTMEFLADLYINTRLRSFRDCSAASLNEKRRQQIAAACTQPSPTERLRVLTAFYRRQLLCNVWAPTDRVLLKEDDWFDPSDEEIIAISNTTMDEVDENSSDIGRPLGLLDPFEEWEQQQIDHINVFVSRLCAALCLAAEAHNDPISKMQLGEMMCKSASVAKYVRDHKPISDEAMVKVSSFPQYDRDWRARTSRDGRDHPYHAAIEMYSLPFFTSEWHGKRVFVCPDLLREDGYYCRFVKDEPGLPPFGWVNAVNEWCQNWVGRTFVGEKGEVDDTYKDIADLYWPEDYALAVFRVGGLTMWDRIRVEAIKRLPQLALPGTLRTGWAQAGVDSDIDPMEYLYGSEFGSHGWDSELGYNSDLIPEDDEDSLGSEEGSEGMLRTEEGGSRVGEVLELGEQDSQGETASFGSEKETSDADDDDTSDW